MISQEQENDVKKLKKEQHIVAFLDILGFKDKVETYSDEEPDFLNKLTSAFEHAQTQTIDFFKNSFSKEYDTKINFKQFSDCIYISIPYTGEEELVSNFSVLIYLLINYQMTLLMYNIYVRGGVSTGFHFENENTIFSKGLLNAHFIETKRALYPRIVVDNELINKIKLLIRYKPIRTFENCLLRDWDETILINPFDFFQILKEPLNKFPEFKELAIKIILTNFKSTGVKLDLNEEIIKKLAKEDIFDNFTGDLNKNLYQNRVLKNIEKEIKEFQKKLNENPENIKNYEILRKYLWLRELIRWNQDENSSKIKFEYVF